MTIPPAVLKWAMLIGGPILALLGLRRWHEGKVADAKAKGQADGINAANVEEVEQADEANKESNAIEAEVAQVDASDSEERLKAMRPYIKGD